MDVTTTTPRPYEDMFIMIIDTIATMECRKPVNVRAILIIKLLKVNMLCSTKVTTVYTLARGYAL